MARRLGPPLSQGRSTAWAIRGCWVASEARSDQPHLQPGLLHFRPPIQPIQASLTTEFKLHAHGPRAHQPSYQFKHPAACGFHGVRQLALATCSRGGGMARCTWNTGAARDRSAPLLARLRQRWALRAGRPGRLADALQSRAQAAQATSCHAHSRRGEGAGAGPKAGQAERDPQLDRRDTSPSKFHASEQRQYCNWDCNALARTRTHERRHAPAAPSAQAQAQRGSTPHTSHLVLP
jgi:hypothetical protein